ncbi:MAG: tetratricopeptide repeat protein [Planctomycetaceae bacterium]|jgi:tetratricopeptide (TPR) repeat protein|nr:tetratricopeptide repeat protein [Planctomycetaceae bacterium]
MQTLSKVLSIIFFALLMQFTFEAAVSLSGVLSGNGKILYAVQDSPAGSADVVTNKQLQYYQNQYANKPANTTQIAKPAQPMGGYPNNIANLNSNNNNNSNNAASNNSVVNSGAVYVASASDARNILPTNPAITSTNPVSGSLNTDAVAGRATDNLSAFPVVQKPKSDTPQVSGDSAVGVGANLSVGRVVVPDSGVAAGKTGSDVKGNSVDTKLPVKDVSLPDSGVVVPKSDSRLKPTESMQEMLLNPQKIKSLLPSFLLRKKIDDPLGEDDGLAAVDKIHQGKTMTERMYIESATKSKTVVSKDIFIKAMSEESAGNYGLALDLYKEFIRLNSRRTSDGTLAVPYHRLALIAWGRQRAVNEADVCFRYALKYAKDGIVQVIVNDYNRFLTECGKLDQAEAILRNTISLFPYESQLKVELGRCLARQDRAVEALRHIRPVLGEAQAYIELAAIYKGRGDYAMSDVLMQKRDEFIANANWRDRAIADAAKGTTASNNIRNDNSNTRRNNYGNNNVESGRSDLLLSELGREVGARRGVPFPATGRNVAGRVDGGNGSDLPVDPFNIAANGGEDGDVGLAESDSTAAVLLSGGQVNSGMQEVGGLDNNLSNNEVQPVATNQLQATESTTPPVYKIKGYHYSVEDVAPVFLQY